MSDQSEGLPILNMAQKSEIEGWISAAFANIVARSSRTPEENFIRLCEAAAVRPTLTLETAKAFIMRPVDLLQNDMRLFLALPRVLQTIPDRVYGKGSDWRLCYDRLTAEPASRLSRKAKPAPRTKIETPPSKGLSVAAAGRIIRRAKRSSDEIVRHAPSDISASIASSSGLSHWRVSAGGGQKRGQLPSALFYTEAEAEAAGFLNHSDKFFDTKKPTCERKEKVVDVWFRCTKEVAHGTYCADHGGNVEDLRATRQSRAKNANPSIGGNNR